LPGKVAPGHGAEFDPKARIAWVGFGPERKNPARDGSGRYARVEKLMRYDGKTVAEYLEAGSVPATLANSIRLKIAELKQ
jgi:hypothetical protein